MLFATDDIGMSILLNPDLASTLTFEDMWGDNSSPVGFSVCYKEMTKAMRGEIGSTLLMNAQGYEVDTMIAAFHAAKSPRTYCEENENPQDILYEGRYYGGSVHPYEVIFIKTNRNIGPTTLDNFSKWHLSMKGSSWDTCGR
jgi:hypothetical protein